MLFEPTKTVHHSIQGVTFPSALLALRLREGDMLSREGLKKSSKGTCIWETTETSHETRIVQIFSQYHTTLLAPGIMFLYTAKHAKNILSKHWNIIIPASVDRTEGSGCVFLNIIRYCIVVFESFQGLGKDVVCVFAIFVRCSWILSRCWQYVHTHTHIYIYILI